MQSANQELGTNVERLKDQLKSSEESTQQYKQKSLSLEQRLIETETRLNKAEQSVMSHDDIQERLNKRCFVFCTFFPSFTRMMVGNF